MKDRIAMAVSVLTRMAVGLTVFVLMARGLGPAAYGLVVTVMAYATLVSLVTDFGFASKTLRDIAADRANGGNILNASLNVKIYLTVIAMVVGAIIILALPAPGEARPAMIMLGAATLIAAIGDLSLTAFRATGRYLSETWITLWTSAVHLAVVGWISLAHGDITLLAAAFLISRLIYTILALSASMRLFPGTRFHIQWPRHILRTAAEAWSWAVDSGMNYLNSQMDGLLIAPIFGLHAAGIYQSGSRFIQAALNMVSILANIHIPKMARASTSDTGKIFIVLVEFAAVGAFFALVFWLGGGLITQFLLGPSYSEVDALWPGFAVFVFIRYVAAAAGAQLAALGLPKVRIAGQLLGLVSLILGFVLILPNAGYSAAPWIMSASASTICILYWWALLARARNPSQVSQNSA